VSVLVSATELRSGGAAVLLDVRWALGDDRGRERYLEGHLPGAVYVDLETELADPASAAGGATRCRRCSDCKPPHGAGE
jgi:3-mercaptopyruvate sulfurtransferase SseA